MVSTWFRHESDGLLTYDFGPWVHYFWADGQWEAVGTGDVLRRARARWWSILPHGGPEGE